MKMQKKDILNNLHILEEESTRHRFTNTKKTRRETGKPLSWHQHAQTQLTA